MIAIIGIGAIGSWLTMYLARPEWELLLWDDDRVAQENLATSAFLDHHIGAFKAVVASELAAGKGCYAKYITETLDERTIGKLGPWWDVILGGFTEQQVNDWLTKASAPPQRGSIIVHNEEVQWKLVGPALIVDCLDNAPSRKLLCSLSIPTVHIGVSDAGSGAIIWDEDYQVPDDGYERGENPVCTHHLSRAVLRMVATAAASVIEDFMNNGVRRNQLVTSRGAL